MSTHLRGMVKTACDIELWIEDDIRGLVTSVDSVADPRIPGQPVTCPECLAWLEKKPAPLPASWTERD